MINPLLILASEAAAEKEGIAVLGIDPKAIILQAGTFLLLFLLVKKFALRGIVDTLELNETNEMLASFMFEGAVMSIFEKMK